MKMKADLRRACAAALALSVTLLASACGGASANAPARDTLTVAYPALGERLNPFYVTTDCEQALMELTQLTPLTLDRVGDVVKKGIEGETRSYAGADYNYSGPCDLTIRVDEETGGAAYTLCLREGMCFSDGVPLTADDVLFSLYVLCDPSYDGPSSLKYSPITGLGSYITQTEPEKYAALGESFDRISAAGAGHLWNEDDAWSQDEQGAYNDAVAAAWREDLAAVTDYCVTSYAAIYGETLLGLSGDEILADESLHVAFTMAAWGFAARGEDGVYATVLGSTYTLADGDVPTLDAFYSETYTVYGGDPAAYWEDVNGGEIDEDDVLTAARNTYIATLGSGATIAAVSGLERTDARTVTIRTDTYDAGDIYRLLDFYIAPLHCYGDPALFDPAAGSFGFPRGDLSSVAARDGAPLGAGSYVFTSRGEDSISLSANPSYYGGLPATPRIELCRTDGELVSAVTGGLSDIVTFDATAAAIEQIKNANAGGELTGDVITAFAADLPTYGYIGINAATVRVGDDPDGDASIALRRGLATLFAVYREAAVSGYFGGAARVINYPISETSYFAPTPADEGYAAAFSTLPDGGAIYAADMSTEGRYAAALAAAKQYFLAAGYTFSEETGRFTAAPEGAALSFEAIVPGGGTGDHPCYAIIKKAAEALSGLGITLTITDPVSSSLLWDRLRAGSQQIWCAARPVAAEPDMRDAYAASSTPAYGGSNYSGISDDVLDFYITSARVSGDRAFRRVSYRQCLDLILSWAVELPVYQRQAFTLFSSERLDTGSVPGGLTIYYPWTAVAHSLRMR